MAATHRGDSARQEGFPALPPSQGDAAGRGKLWALKLGGWAMAGSQSMCQRWGANGLHQAGRGTTVSRVPALEHQDLGQRVALAAHTGPRSIRSPCWNNDSRLPLSRRCGTARGTASGLCRVIEDRRGLSLTRETGLARAAMRHPRWALSQFADADESGRARPAGWPRRMPRFAGKGQWQLAK